MALVALRFILIRLANDLFNDLSRYPPFFHHPLYSLLHGARDQDMEDAVKSVQQKLASSAEEDRTPFFAIL